LLLFSFFGGIYWPGLLYGNRALKRANIGSFSLAVDCVLLVIYRSARELEVPKFSISQALAACGRDGQRFVWADFKRKRKRVAIFVF